MKKLLLAISATACLSAHAEFQDGNKLYENMRSNNGYLQGAAMGYVIGVTDALHGITHCTPAGVTAGQIYDMVKQYLEENPSFRHFTGDFLINRVLNRAWPCETKKKGNAL